MTDVKTVLIGEDMIQIRRFKTFKAAVAGDILAAVSDDWRALIAEGTKYDREWRAENPIQITRQQCGERALGYRAGATRLRAQIEAGELPDEITPEMAEGRVAALEARADSWDQQLADMGGRDYVELPNPDGPGEYELALVVVPLALRTMRTQVIQLVALLLTPDDELKAMWRKDDVYEQLEQKGMDLLERMEVGQEIELAIAVKEVLDDQLRPHMQGLAKLRALYARQKTPEPTKTPDSSPSESPTSSTPSDPPTDGAPRTSSSDSPTERTEPSPVG